MGHPEQKLLQDNGETEPLAIFDSSGLCLKRWLKKLSDYGTPNPTHGHL